MRRLPRRRPRNRQRRVRQTAETKKAPNQIVRLALILFLVSAIVSGVLGFVNMLTKDRIKEQEEAARAAAYNAVLASDTYTDVTYDKEAFPTVDALVQAGDSGWVVELTFSGAQSSITAAFGVAPDYSITGASVISHAETSGLGAKITESEFLDSFVGQTEGMAVTKDGGTVDSITAATISSRAMANAANTAIAVCKSLG